MCTAHAFYTSLHLISKRICKLNIQLCLRAYLPQHKATMNNYNKCLASSFSVFLTYIPHLHSERIAWIKVHSVQCNLNTANRIHYTNHSILGKSQFLYNIVEWVNKAQLSSNMRLPFCRFFFVSMWKRSVDFVYFDPFGG